VKSNTPSLNLPTTSPLVNLVCQLKHSKHYRQMQLNTYTHSLKISGIEEALSKNGKLPSSRFSTKIMVTEKNPQTTNYRGIILQDAFARLLSALITGRLNQLIKKCGIDEQYAYQEETGTQDAVYCL
jgi:hypothetical protein